MARVKVKLINSGVAELLDSQAVGDFVEGLALDRAGGLLVRGFHSKIERGGGHRSVADIVDDSPGAIQREARTGHLASLIGGAARVRYVSAAGHRSYVSAAQAAHYSRGRST